jgi:SnoaL-like domain
VIARALAKDPAARYPSAGDLGRAAVAAARGRTATDELRSVARGEAAPANGAPATAPLTLTTTVVGARRQPPTAALSRRRQPWREIAIIAALLVIGAVVTLIAVSSGGSDPNRPLSASDVASTARAFASAYSREDAGALGSLLAADVERVSPADSERGRASVLAAYRAQFRANRTRAYRLDGLTASGGPVGRAAAHFTVTRDGRPPIVGRVVLGVARIDGRPLIRLIATEPRS